MRTSKLLSILAVGGLTGAGLVGCGDDLEVTPVYNEQTGRIEVHMSRGLEDGETLFIQARRGHYGTLDCAALARQLEPVSASEGRRYFGPAIDPALLQPFYGPEWAGEPTAEMLAAIELGTDSIVDVCLMNGSEIVRQIEGDLFQAVDAADGAGLGGKADDPASGEVQIASAQKYGERCVAELGEIPFFEKNGEGDYGTYNCLDSTPIPMTVTSAGGTVTQPEGEVAQCDKPQYIYSLCEQGPRVASRINEQGTRWVLLCRKSIGGLASDQFNDIAMIGSNPFTGKTCFFQNALYQKKDGGKVPHPADKVKSTTLWSGVHGGEGNGIECADCHDADPFIHTPWIDGAKDANGRSIVPKMGEDEDLPMGVMDAPYKLVNRAGQGWAPLRQITAPEAAACTSCHRMGDEGRWVNQWLTRLEQKDTAWEGIVTPAWREFARAHWMPLDVSGLDAATWASSPVGQALDFLQACGDAGTCAPAPIPDAPAGANAGGNGKLRNPVSLSDDELAQQSLATLDVAGCNSCHSRTQGTFREWHELTETAESAVFANADGGTAESTTRQVQVRADELEVSGPYEVALGGSLTVSMSGTGPADLYVRRGAEPTTDSYDCRPYAEGATESCALAGIGKYWIGVRGAGGTAQATLQINYGAPGANDPTPMQRINAMRVNPDNTASPYLPAKVGIYSVAAHLGPTAGLFAAAFADQGDQWILEYGKYKSRVSMPKGNHPRLTQEQFDVVAEWFARGLPELETYLQEDPAPTTCTDYISSEMQAHISAMETQGWRAINESRNMNMYGCAGAASPEACLASLPRAQAWEAGAGQLRVLKTLGFDTFYWMRSSADGRFIANGDSSGGMGAMIQDLQTGADMPTEAAYDPGFFPGGDGWMFQATPIGTAFCTTNVLTDNPSSIDFSDARCSSVNGVGLYQHLGASLGGQDYFAINSQFTSDNGGTDETSDPSAAFSSDNEMKLTPMTFNGTHYVTQASTTVDAPFMGDSVLSPSNRLVISRLAGPNGAQLGYAVHKVDTSTAGGQLSVQIEEVARYCSKGAKPSISFDERFAVTHHYESNGSANIYVTNLATGVRTKVTSMQPGQYALFPHYRSDNWFYFLVRDHNTGEEKAVASNASLFLD